MQNLEVPLTIGSVNESALVAATCSFVRLLGPV
jgi:hypothetical protein